MTACSFPADHIDFLHKALHRGEPVISRRQFEAQDAFAIQSRHRRAVAVEDGSEELRGESNEDNSRSD